jgi:hypothetical protein
MPENVNELVDKVEALLSLSREDIVDAAMRLREHALELFNEERIEYKITALFNFLASRCYLNELNRNSQSIYEYHRMLFARKINLGEEWLVEALLTATQASLKAIS